MVRGLDAPAAAHSQVTTKHEASLEVEQEVLADRTDAIERLNDVIYYLTLASNGFDGLGHYLRAGLVTNVCSTYALEPSPACRSTFYDPAAETSTRRVLRSVRTRGTEMNGWPR